MENKMLTAAHTLMRILLNVMEKGLEERLLKIEFTSRFCKIVKWQHGLIIGYMKTKT
jgi:hypothetical protein